MNASLSVLDAKEMQTIKIKDFTVVYAPDLDGGGIKFGQDYIYYVRDHFPRRPKRVFEFCSGPAFIGFGLLAHGLCETLCLADINPKAIAAAKLTISMNDLADRVSLYQADCYDGVPATESWDLVVGNPPHSGTDLFIPEWDVPELIYQDQDWALHRRFYKDVAKRLAPDGVVLLQEAYRFSNVDTFRTMIEAGSLKIVRSEACILDPRRYYIWSEKAT